MTTEEIIRLIISFLGGGLISGIINWLRSHHSEKKAQKISNLQAKIQNLYAPLQFFALQNENYFELNKQFHAAYQIEYEGENLSRDETTHKHLEQESKLTLNIANKYIKMVTENNEKILEIIKNNYAYIDSDDVEVLSKFIVDYIRLKTETDDFGRLNTPLQIYEHIGSISFMRPEFITHIKEKFNTKKKELDALVS